MPGTRARDYLALGKLLRARKSRTIGELMACHGTLYERLWQPLLLAALNTDPPESSAALAAAIIRGSLAKGGAACRPLIAADGLAAAFVDPALHWLEANGASVRLDRPLRALDRSGGRATVLKFVDETIDLGATDSVVLAVPAPAAASLMPGLSVPKSFRSIVNAHFKMVPPPIAATDSGTGARHGGMDLRLSRPNFDHHQRRRPFARSSARDADTDAVVGRAARHGHR